MTKRINPESFVSLRDMEVQPKRDLPEKLIVACDIDNVLNNLTELWVTELNKKHKTDVKYANVTEYDMMRAFPTLSENDVYIPLRGEELYKALRPTVGAVEAMANLNEKTRLLFVSATHPSNVVKKWDFMRSFFPYVCWQQLVFLQDKSLVKADVMIDDCVDNLERFDGVRVVYEQPWNTSYMDCDIRLKGWNDPDARALVR